LRGAAVGVRRILWPAFLAAFVAELLLSSVSGEACGLVGDGEWVFVVACSLQFFGYWLIGMFSSGMTCCLLRNPVEVNRMMYSQLHDHARLPPKLWK
jgi:hypothetical protein